MSGAVHKVGKQRWRIAQRVEQLWWRRYLKGRDPHDYVAWKRSYWSEFLRRIGLSPKPGARVLDAGCGPAGIFMTLQNCKVTAVDPLLPTYRSYSHFQLAKHAGVEFVSEQLEFFSSHDLYDYVFCLNVINHVRDLSRVCDVLRDHVAPGGHLIVSVDAHRWPWLKPVFKLLPGDVLHPHQMSLAEYKAALQTPQFELVDEQLYQRELIFDYHVLILRRA